MLNQFAVEIPTIPVDQCHSPTSSNTWRDVETFFRNAEPQRRAAKHLVHAWYIGKRFCKSDGVFFSTLSAGIESMEFRKSKTDSLITSGNMKIGHQFKIRGASQDRQPKIQSSLVRETLQRIMEQTNNDCRFRIFILTNSLRQLRLFAGR